MTPKQRIATRIAFILVALAGALMTTVLTQKSSEASDTAFSGTFYGAYENLMTEAIGGNIWPQATSNACAVTDAIGVVNYDYLRWGFPPRFINNDSQSIIEKENQVLGSSQWGRATPINPWGGVTNIAADFGNDPRSVAYMTSFYGVKGTNWHNYIYRWQFAHSSRPSFWQQAREATTLVARNLENFREPVVVFINGGLHSVLVTGVWSTSNPNTSFPANIQGVVYHDPEGNATSSRQEVPIDTWMTGNYANPFGVYSLWSLYYGDRSTRGDKLNVFDPEPKVGIYTPTSANPQHWYLGFTWVARDNNSGYNADWAFNAVSGQVMTSP